MRRTVSILPLLAVSLYLPAQTPTLVRDINPVSSNPASSRPTGGPQGGAQRALDRGTFVAMGTTLYFIASTDQHGAELYSTLGLPGTTKRLTDIAPGPASSNISYITVAGSKLFFSATDQVQGIELYVYDTAAPNPVASLVKDINPGGHSLPTDITAVGQQVFFRADDGTHGAELWMSDGTAAGTIMLKDIAGTGSSTPDFLTGFGGRLYFAATGSSGRELWTSDGTPSGTTQVADIHPGAGSAGVAYLTALGPALYFSANEGTSGVELWRFTPGTGVQQVHDVNPGAGSSTPRNLTVFQGRLYFTAYRADTGNDLWWTDGATLTPVDARAGQDSATPTDLTVVGAVPNQRLVFAGFGAGTGKELYVHDGANTNLIEIVPGIAGSEPRAFAGAGGGFLFRARGPGGDIELWKSDGSAAGTGLLADIHRSGSSNPDFLTETIVGRVLFSADDGVRGVELWSSDGSAAGTALLADLNPNLATASADPRELVDGNGVLYFAADDGIHGQELWKSDGTAAGTVLVADLNPGSNSSFPVQLRVLGGKLFFIAAHPGGYELHCLDLANDKIVRTGLIAASSAPPLPVFTLVPLGGKVFLPAVGAGIGGELFCSDGTVAGSRLVKDIRPGSGDSLIRSMTVVEDKIYFSADDGLTGQELWVTDGTTAGTRRVLDLLPGAVGSEPRYITPVGGRLVFRAYLPATGAEIFVSDGTPSGTAVVDLRPGSLGSGPKPSATSFPLYNNDRFPIAGGLAFFTCLGPSGIELYRSDGTAAGTGLVADILPGRGSSMPISLAVRGDALFFRARGPVAGAELWKSDGTAAGTVRVADIVPGNGDSAPFGIAAAGSRRVLFSATGVGIGSELHVSDGTAAGTRLVQDIHTGTKDSDPGWFTTVGGRVFFTAVHPDFGRELFVVDLGALATRAGNGCSATGRVPVLDSTDPVIGGPVTTEVSGAPANGAGVILIGLRATAGGWVDLGAGCVIHIDVSKPFVPLPFATGPAGRYSVTATLPNDPTQIGSTFALQAGVGPAVTPPLGVDLSNLLLTTYGR